jgi:hypothetical protein
MQMARRKLSFYTGAALSADSFTTLATFDGRGHPAEPSGDYSFDVFDRKTGTWRHVTDGKDTGESVAAWKPGGLPQAVAINRIGRVIFDDVPLREEQPYSDPAHPWATDGMTIGTIAGRLYAIGGAGHFFWRDAGSDWTVLDPAFFKPDAFALTISQLTKKLGGLPPNASLIGIPIEEDIRLSDLYQEYTATFLTITGTCHNNITLAGPAGRVLHFDGTRISKMDSGVTEALVGSATGPDGAVWLCGGGSKRKPVLLTGDRQRGFTSVLQQQISGLYPYKMAFLGPDLYLCDVSDATGGVYRVGPDGLTKLRIPGAPEPVPTWQVDAADGVLWVLEAKALNRFDGQVWERFTHPDA